MGGVRVDKDELYFIFSGQSKYYEAYFEIIANDGTVQHIKYAATPGPHIFNYATLETTWCNERHFEEINDIVETVTGMIDSYTMEQEVRRRMRLMDRFLIDKAALRVGEKTYQPLAEGRAMVNNDIDTIVSIVDVTSELFNLNEHTAREE